MSQNLCINVHSTNVNSENISRHNMIKWVNQVLGTKYKKVEELCKGDAYCRFIDMIFPGSVPIKKVKLDPLQEPEFIQNFKFVQAAFRKVGCDKEVPIAKVVKGRFQDNLEFLQWFHKFFIANYHGQEYATGEAFIQESDRSVPAVTKVTTGSSRVLDKDFIAPSKALGKNVVGSSKALGKNVVALSRTPGRSTTFDKKQTVTSSQIDELNQHTQQVANLKLVVQTAERERDFYYDKLRRIEDLSKVEPVDEFKQALLNILYADMEQSESEHGSDDECF